MADFVDLFGYSLSITYGDGSIDVTGQGLKVHKMP